jgi:PAS domain S-box-containing protein
VRNTNLLLKRHTLKTEYNTTIEYTQNEKGNACIYLDENNTVIRVNEQACYLLGKTMQELYGKDITELFLNWVFITLQPENSRKRETSNFLNHASY